MQIIIRNAQPGDYRAIGELIRNELGYPQIDIDKLYARLDKMNADETHMTLVAESNGETVGFIGTHRGLSYNVETEYLQIFAMAVKKAFQNKGIGSQLIKRVEDYVITNGIERITLTSRLHRIEAHSFYEGNGFTKKSYGFMKEYI